MSFYNIINSGFSLVSELTNYTIKGMWGRKVEVGGSDGEKMKKGGSDIGATVELGKRQTQAEEGKGEGRYLVVKKKEGSGIREKVKDEKSGREEAVLVVTGVESEEEVNNEEVNTSEKEVNQEAGADEGWEVSGQEKRNKREKANKEKRQKEKKEREEKLAAQEARIVAKLADQRDVKAEIARRKAEKEKVVQKSQCGRGEIGSGKLEQVGVQKVEKVEGSRLSEYDLKALVAMRVILMENHKVGGLSNRIIGGEWDNMSQEGQEREKAKYAKYGEDLDELEREIMRREGGVELALFVDAIRYGCLEFSREIGNLNSEKIAEEKRKETLKTYLLVENLGWWKWDGRIYTHKNGVKDAFKVKSLLAEAVVELFLKEERRVMKYWNGLFGLLEGIVESPGVGGEVITMEMVQGRFEAWMMGQTDVVLEGGKGAMLADLIGYLTQASTVVEMARRIGEKTKGK